MRQAHISKTARNKRFAMTFLMLLFAYIMFHLFISERSIPTLLSLSSQEKILTVQLAELELKKASILDRVIRLRPETFDMDMANEYSIQMLGHTNNTDFIILSENNL